MMKNELLLSLDPDTKAIGAALFKGGTLMHWNVLRSGVDDSIRRIEVLGGLLWDTYHNLMAQTKVMPEVVIETPSIHQNARSGAGLAVYGFAVGRYYEQMHTASDGNVSGVSVDEWTRDCRSRAGPAGGGARIMSKVQRAATVAAEYETYDPAKDEGSHAADAIALGAWFVRKREAERAILAAEELAKRATKKKRTRKKKADRSPVTGAS